MDPSQEQQRLAETYSRLTEAELALLAARSGELTDLAREALRTEMKRRSMPLENLELTRVDAAGVNPEPQDQVTIRRFRDLPEALLAKGMLESAGIECFLLDDNMVRLDWFWSNLIGGMRLQVAGQEVDSAIAILDQPIPEDLDVTDIGEYHQPRCPKCESLDVAYQELNRPVAYISSYLGVPIPLERRAWRCHSCHAEWKDVDMPADPEQPA